MEKTMYIIGAIAAAIWLIIKWPLSLARAIISFPLLLVLMVLAMFNTIISYVISPGVVYWAASLTGHMAGFAIVQPYASMPGEESGTIQ